MTGTVTVRGFTPRPSQRMVLDDHARIKVLACGRRWGKTLLGSNWLDEGAYNEGGENWWVSPTYSQAKLVYREKIDAAERGGAIATFRDVSDSELRIKLHTGGVMHFKSGDNYHALRGPGLKRVVLDEAAFMAKEVWEQIIRPTLADTRGKALILSTPKGKNWFFKMFNDGQDPLIKDTRSWRFPTSDNPLIPESELADAKRSLPVDVYEQEYEAKFLDNSAGVFRNVRDCEMSAPAEPVPGRQYYAGLDLARLSDFTVLTILDESGAQVYLDRFNMVDWTIQVQRVARAIRRYNNARLLQDSTGVGDPIYDALRREGLPVDGYKFTNESKGRLIEFLQLAYDQKQIKTMPDPVQRAELEMYEYTIGRSGTVSYNAPAGQHDDTVIALALAWWNLGHRATLGYEVL